MPDPVAVSQFSEYTAASGVGLRTTGGTRCIIRCNPATGNLGADSLSSAVFTVGNPHAKTKTLKTSQGTQALATSARLCPWVPRAARSPSCSKPQMRLGRHFNRNPIKAAMETTAATTSTSHGPWKFDMRNCGMAKNTPATKTAGQTSIIPAKPANAHTSQNGTRTEKNGRIRPACALNCRRSNPVTPCSAISGVPIAPYATGAVFAISDSPDAWSGLKPKPINTAAVTATGVPKPAAPSKNAPKLKAISSNCRRRSWVIPVRLSCSTLNSPASQVS